MASKTQTSDTKKSDTRVWTNKTRIIIEDLSVEKKMTTGTAMITSDERWTLLGSNGDAITSADTNSGSEVDLFVKFLEGMLTKKSNIIIEYENGPCFEYIVTAPEGLYILQRLVRQIEILFQLFKSSKSKSI